MKKILSNLALVSCSLIFINCAGPKKSCADRDSCSVKKAEKSCCKNEKESCGDSCKVKQ